MASSPSSIHSSVSGLGIIYQPALSPTAPSFSPGAPASAVPQHLRAAGRRLQHSVSHDAGLRQHAQMQEQQQQQQYKYRNEYDLHGRSGGYDTAVYRQDGRGGVARVQQGGKGQGVSPEADFGMGLGGGFRTTQDYPTYRVDDTYAQSQGLSPVGLSPHSYSSASLSPSGTSDYSPQPMSNLPSADSHSGLQPSFYQYQQHLHPTLHPAPSSYSSAECSAYEAEAANHLAVPVASTSGARQYDSQAGREPTVSRLPAFLLERRARGLTRPQSMMELGERYARDSQERSEAPVVVNTRQQPNQYDRAVQNHDSHGALRDSAYTVASTSDSVPSSAGGLQRRHYERQLADVRAQAEAATQAPALAHSLKRAQSQDSLASSRAPRPVSRQERTRTRSRSMSGAEVARLAHRAEDEPRASPALGRPTHARTKSDLVNMRSWKGMEGLGAAEGGGGYVRLSKSRGGFVEGEDVGGGAEEMEDEVVESEGEDEEERDRVGSVAMRPDSVFSQLSGAPSGSSASGSHASHASQLSRQTTLLTAGANPTRRQHELNRLLQPSSTKKSLAAAAAAVLPSSLESPASASSASLAPSSSSHGRPASRAMSRASSQPSLLAAATPVILEQAKSSSKARVELDLVLESGMVVEGGALNGKIEVKVRRPRSGEPDLWLGAPKVRVVGFEELASQEARHIFFHHASSVAALPNGQALPLRSSVLPLDEEGFRPSVEGTHRVPFRMELPVGKGAKGTWKCKQGSVRYIVIASVKLKSADGADRSIAHFYRTVEVFPYFAPAIVLAPAARAITASESKALFLGGSGKVSLTATIHRSTWVAGQRCYVSVQVDNDSHKKIKTLALSLIRTTTVFRAKPWLNAGSGTDHQGELDIDQDACATSTTRKKVAEAVLEMGKKGAKGVTAKGSWMGVEGGESAEFSHSLLVPEEELTVPRGRHLEVAYTLRVAVGGSLSGDVSVDLAVRLINFVSIDPPPGHVAERGAVLRTAKSGRRLNKSWSTDQLRAAKGGAGVGAGGQGNARLKRMESVDELRLEELNLGAPLSTQLAQNPLAHAFAYTASPDSQTTTAPSQLNPTPSTVYSVNLASHLDSLSLAEHDGHSPPFAFDSPTHAADVASAPAPRFQGQHHSGRTLERQMSLECISSALSSATARRSVPMGRAKSGLSVETRATVGEEDDYLDERDREAAEAMARRGLAMGQPGEGTERRIELDDLDEDEDEVDGLDFAEESEDEIDAFMQGALADDDDENEGGFDASSAPPTARQRERSGNSAGGRSPLMRAPVPASPRKVIVSAARPALPVKVAGPAAAAVVGAGGRASVGPASPGKAGGKFGYASPGSPVKARVSTVAGGAEREKEAHSPVRRVLSHASLASAARRALPTAPLAARPSSGGVGAAARVPLPPSPTKAQMDLRRQSSMASLRPAPGTLRKAASARSLRPAGRGSPVSGSEASPTFGSSSEGEGLLSPSTVGSSPELDVKSPALAGASPTISISAAEASPRALPSATANRLTARPPKRSPPLSPRPAHSPSNPAPRSPRTLHTSKSLSSLRPASSAQRDRLAPAVPALPGAGRGPAPAPPPRTRPLVLASVKSKVAAMESRQDALKAFAARVDAEAARDAMGAGAGAGVGAGGSGVRVAGAAAGAGGAGLGADLARRGSVSSLASEAPSFRLGDLERANSVASFKAPLFRRRGAQAGEGEP